MSNQDEQKDLKQAIMEVIVFFDMFDFPLTAWEIWKYLAIKCDLADVRKVLASEDCKKKIGNKNGTYFLPGREQIYETRMNRYNYANAKFKKALRIASLYRIFPWVKMIAVVNMFGANNLKQEGDIDLFIVAKRNRIWLTRFCCTGLAAVLRLRPTPQNVRDKFCLSFFISEANLNLQNLLLPSDTHFGYWLANFIPIYNVDNTWSDFMAANGWLNERLPNWQPTNDRRLTAGKGFVLLEFIFGWLEPIVKNWQMNHLPAKIKAMANQDTRVVVNDSILKFHVNDRREEYNKNYKSRIINYV